MFSILVPAFEEERTIGEVVRSVRGIGGSELIVIDDGSGDDTAALAREAGARVIRLEVNRGKGQALDAGVRAATGDVLVFLDADVCGMDEEKVWSLTRPVQGGAAMCVGVRHPSLHRLNEQHPWLPIVAGLSGQRCLRRKVWTAARESCSGYGVESALNYVASRSGKVVYVHLLGLSHTIKERKRGLVEGLRQRLRMMLDISAATVRVRTPGTRATGELSRER